jgi:Tfp pilus assembly protein PilF
LEECVDLGHQLASALEHLHKNGLLHRDIKPSNIIFVGGSPKLADVGLVAGLSEARSFVGTDGFIPPEGPGTPQADLYALGKVLFEISTGKDRREFPSLPQDLAEEERMLELNAIILKACKIDLNQRYRSAAEMKEDLALLKRGESVKRKRSRQQYRTAFIKSAVVISAIAMLTALASTVIPRPSDLHSPVPGVDDLVANGEYCQMGRTRERLEEARLAFESAIRKDRKFPPPYVGLFKVRLQQMSALGDPGVDAKRNLRVAITNLMTVAPNFAETKMASAFLHLLDGHLDLTLADASRAMKLPMTSKAQAGFVHCLHGWFLMRAGLPDAAFKELQIAKQQPNREWPVIDLQLGNYHFIKHQFQQALECYQQSIKAERRQVVAYRAAGEAYEELGEFDRAIQHFELSDQNAGQMNASRAASYSQLRAAVKRDPIHGYWQERLRNALAESPQDDHSIAKVLTHLGRMEEARDRLMKASEQGKVDGL